MNNPEVRAVPHMNGWEAQFRKLHRSDWIVVQKGGVGQLFDTEDKAKVAGYEALQQHLFGDGIVSWSEPCKADRFAQAEKQLFRGGGKVIPVEHRRARV